MDQDLDDITKMLVEKFTAGRREIKQKQKENDHVGLLLKTAAPDIYERLVKDEGVEIPKTKVRTLLQLNESEKQEYFNMKKAGDRIVYVVEAFGRAIKGKALQQLIMELEGPTMGKRTVSSLPQKLKYLVNEGKLVLAKYSGSNKYGFYIIPKWKSSSKKIGIIPAHAPLPDEFETLAMESRDPRKIDWIGKH